MSAQLCPARHLTTFAALGVAVLVCAPAAAVRPADTSTPTDRSEAPSFVLTSGELGEVPADQVLPLKASHTSITVAGVVAEVVVRQTWQNTTDAPLEGTYVFPASTRAAVHDLEMTVGDRVIRAEIQEKEKARKTYAAARDNGQTATLLEQKRPNVFQVAVANILPGEEIDVVLTYAELIVPTGGVYEIVAPQVVGPRYGHGNSRVAGGDAWTWKPNPYLDKGKQPFVWSVSVDLRTPLPLASVGSPSHPFAATYRSEQRVTAVFVPDASGAGADRNLVVRYKLQGDAIRTGAMLYRTPRDQENFFLLMMEPPRELADAAIPPREVVFVVDVSGSMRGFPTDVARGLMKDLLEGLRPEDRFNILLFSASSSLFKEESAPATQENITAALDFQSHNATYGGTELARALKRALHLPTSSKTTSRSFVVLTDGYIHAERDTFKLVREHVGDANLFAFGVGRGVNRYLIEGLARAGRSEPFFALNKQEGARETRRFINLVARPALTDIKVSFKGIRVHDVVPADAPDLLAERPLIVFGKYTGPTRGRAIITGRTGEGRFRQVIQIRDNHESKTNRALRTLWARARIRDVSDFSDDAEKQKKELIKLGLTYRLATPFTSFVAVDKVKRTDRTSRRVQQPVAHPAGMERQQMAATGAPPTRKTVIDFSDVAIEGQLTKPQGSYVQSRKKAARGSLMPQAPQRFGSVSGGGGLGARGYGAGAGGFGSSGRASGNAAPRKMKMKGKPAPRGKVAPKKSPSRRDPDPVDLSRASSTSGNRNRMLVHRYLKLKTQSIRACHTERHFSRPGVHGDVDFEVVFDARGKVDKVRLRRNTLHDAELTKCMVDRVRRWRIPQRTSKKGLKVVFSLHFEPLPAKEP